MLNQRVCFYLPLLLVLPLLGLGQSLSGGAGFFYGGRSVWPGAANAIQQVSNTAEGLGTNWYSSLGAEIYVRRDRWLVGAGASALVNKRIQDRAAQLSVESSASNAHVWVGWVAWQSNRAKLYPSVGPGLNSVNVNLTQSGSTTTVYTLTNLTIDVGLTVDWFVFKSSSNPAMQAGSLISIRAGYRLPTASGEWYTNKNSLTLLAPVRYNPQCFYVTFGIGGGGFRHD